MCDVCDKIRVPVMLFAVSMETVLKFYDKDKGQSWKDLSFDYLLSKVIKNSKELLSLITNYNNSIKTTGKHSGHFLDKIGEKAVDIANFAMFVHDNALNIRNEHLLDVITEP